MAEDLILNDLTKSGLTPRNIVLDDAVFTTRTESVSGDIFWRFEDEPEATPQLLGSASAGKTLSVSFDMTHGRAIRLFLVSKTASGNFSVTDVREAVQTVFDPNGTAGGSGMPPFGVIAAAIADDQAQIDWTNNGGTGDNIIQRRFGSSSPWLTVGTVSSGTNTFIDGPVGADGNYYFRVYNEDVPGFSNEASIHLTI